MHYAVPCRFLGLARQVGNYVPVAFETLVRVQQCKENPAVVGKAAMLHRESTTEQEDKPASTRC